MTAPGSFADARQFFLNAHLCEISVLILHFSNARGIALSHYLNARGLHSVTTLMLLGLHLVLSLVQASLVVDPR
jgi:hypothetical protein